MAKPKKIKGKAKGAMPKLHKLRNPFACDPIMSKGGVHETTTKAKRKKDKMAMKKALSKREFDGAFSFLVYSFLYTMALRGIYENQRLHDHRACYATG